LGILRKRKALSPLLIALIVLVAVVVLIVGAVAVYVWVLPVNLKTEEMEFSNFKAVEVGSAFEVTITQSDTYSVRVTADERIFDNVEVTQAENTLTIDFAPGTILGTVNAKAEIKMPVLEELDLSGATTGYVGGFSNTKPFVVNLSGASTLEMTYFEVGDVEVELAGASTLTAEGKGNNLVSVVSGASTLDFSNFPVHDASVNLSAASHAILNLDGKLDLEASGASSLEYIGEPTLGNISMSGASTVNKK
jgi:hypothetical protein